MHSRSGRVLKVWLLWREEGVTDRSSSRRKWSRWRIWRMAYWARWYMANIGSQYDDFYDLIIHFKPSESPEVTHSQTIEEFAWSNCSVRFWTRRQEPGSTRSSLPSLRRGNRQALNTNPTDRMTLVCTFDRLFNTHTENLRLKPCCVKWLKQGSWVARWQSLISKTSLKGFHFISIISFWSF